MKPLLLAIIPFVTIACASAPKLKPCDPEKRDSVFASKDIEINKSVKVNNEKRLVVRSYQKPTITRSATQDRILLEGVEEYSVGGYHTNECTAEKMRADIASAKASVGYKVERKNNSIYVTATDEWRFIHHVKAFSSIKITLPEGMAYQYSHTPLKKPVRK